MHTIDATTSGAYEEGGRGCRSAVCDKKSAAMRPLSVEPRSRGSFVRAISLLRKFYVRCGFVGLGDLRAIS